MEKALPYVIECNLGHYWETIAAFNARCVAQWYMDECAKTNPRFAYRITNLPEEA